MFCHWYPTKTCGQSNPTVRSSWDNVASPVFWWPSTREARGRRPASRQSGARVHGTVNPGEPLLNVVRRNKPKTLTGLSQKACGPAEEFPSLLSQTPAPPANRRDLPHARVCTRNVVSPSSSLGESGPQGTPMGWRVWEDGRSQRRSVMGRIGGEPSGNIPPRESAPTSIGSFRTRAVGQSL